MIYFQKTITSKELLLRPLKNEDFKEMKSLTANKAMWTYFTSDLSQEDELKKWIRTATEAIQNKQRLAFSIIDTNTGEIIGSTSLGNFSERDKRIEIGWTWMAEHSQGTGKNQLVKYLLLEYCFEELELERVESKTDVLNIAARKGLIKSGFVEEGVLRSHTLLANGRRRDSIYYSVLKKEWEKIKK